jgi:hypothetical protein
MRILILDDEDERHEGFKKILSGHELFHAFESAEFKAMFLGQGPFDMICFDHEKISDMYGYSEITGLHMANFVLRQPERLWPKQVLVHSWNPDGAANIAAAFEGKIPVRVLPFKQPTPKNPR